MVILASAKAKPWIGRDEETQCMLVFVLQRQHFTGTTALFVSNIALEEDWAIPSGNNQFGEQIIVKQALQVSLGLWSCVRLIQSWFEISRPLVRRLREIKEKQVTCIESEQNNYETIHDMQQIKFYGFTLITAKNFHTQCNLVVWAIPEIEIQYMPATKYDFDGTIKISIHWLHSKTPNIRL